MKVPVQLQGQSSLACCTYDHPSEGVDSEELREERGESWDCALGCNECDGNGETEA